MGRFLLFYFLIVVTKTKGLYTPLHIRLTIYPEAFRKKYKRDYKPRDKNTKLGGNSKMEIEYKSRKEEPKVFSRKLNSYLDLKDIGETKEIQKYNIGLGPGSWY